MNWECELLVVGAGPGGVAAAIQGRRLGLDVMLVDATGQAGGLLVNAYEVQNSPFLEAPVSGARLARIMTSNLDRWGIPVKQARVLSFRKYVHGFEVFLEQGSIASRAVILATGTVPRRLDVPGEVEAMGRRLWYSVSEAWDTLSGVSTVVVVGGGEAAFDQALSCARRLGLKTMLLVRSVPRVHGWLLEEVRREPGITILNGVRVRAVESHEDGVTVLTSGGPLESGAILVSIGRERNVPDGAPALAEHPCFHIIGDARRGALGQATSAAGEGLLAAMEVSRCIRSKS